MPHIPNEPDLGLKPMAPPVDASTRRGNARVTHPVMYRFGRGIGWVLVFAAICLCAVLSVAAVTALAHLYWRVTEAVWGHT